MEGVSNFWPAIAVPMTVKIPEPMTAPMPSPVSDHGPRDFLSRCSASWESEISLSMDLHAKSWFASVSLPVWNQSEFKQNGVMRASRRRIKTETQRAAHFRAQCGSGSRQTTTRPSPYWVGRPSVRWRVKRASLPQSCASRLLRPALRPSICENREGLPAKQGGKGPRRA